MRTCGFCGHPAVAHSRSERCDICERCMLGYHAGDTYGIKEPHPIADAVLFGHEIDPTEAKIDEIMSAPLAHCLGCNSGIIGEYNGVFTRFCNCIDGLAAEREIYAEWRSTQAQEIAAEERWSQIAW